MISMLIFFQSQMDFFLGSFSTAHSYQVFVVLVVGFFVKSKVDGDGVTSFVRALDLRPSKYDTLIRAHRSHAFNLGSIREQWWKCVEYNGLLLKYGLHNRNLLIGDGTAKSHYGNKMPGNAKMAKYGNKSLAVQYFFGQAWGAIGAVIHNANSQFCIPLFLWIQGGLKGIETWFETEIQGKNNINERIRGRELAHTIQLITNAYKVATVIGTSIIVLDRAYLSVPMLSLLQQLNASAPLLYVVTRAKTNTAAFYLPGPQPPGKRGRKPLKGNKFSFANAFQTLNGFITEEVSLYNGPPETIQYYVIDLLWGRGLYQLVRFVLVYRPSQKGQAQYAIFVSTDLTLSGLEIIHAYCHRFKIETCFRSLKQVVFAFMSRFWTAAQPVLNKFRKKTDPYPLEAVTDLIDRIRILDTIEAYERFATIAGIAMGIAQMIALNPKYAKAVRRSHWVRTARGEKVSEASVCYCFGKKFNALLAAAPDLRITQIIREFRGGTQASRKGRGAP